MKHLKEMRQLLLQMIPPSKIVSDSLEKRVRNMKPKKFLERQGD